MKRILSFLFVVSMVIVGVFPSFAADADFSGATTSNDYSAYAVDARASYDFAEANSVPLILEAIVGIGSGDDNANDSDIEEFTSPSPSYTHSAIFLDHGDAAEAGAQLSHSGRLQAAGLGNLTWAGLKASYKATEKATINALAATFCLTEGKVTGGTSYQDNELGQEYNLALIYNLAKGLDLTLSGAWFVPEERGWTEVGGTTASDNTVSEYLAMLLWLF